VVQIQLAPTILFNILISAAWSFHLTTVGDFEMVESPQFTTRFARRGREEALTRPGFVQR